MRNPGGGSLSRRSGDLFALNTSRRLPALLLVAVGLLASNLQYSVLASTARWFDFAASLIYVPIVAVAIRHGAAAATAVALAGGALRVLLKSLGSGSPWSGVLLETLLFAGVGWMAALLPRNTLTRTPAGNLGDRAPETGSASESRESWETVTLTRIVVGLVRQFGTPIASIDGAGWMLEDAGLPEEKRREFVDIIRKEANRLSRMLSEVLDFTRPRQPQFQQLQLPALVDQAIHLADPKGHGPTVLFEKHIPAGLPDLRGDPDQIRQALLNLVMNAVQASPRGDRIKISARFEDPNVVITVKDHGNGVPEVVRTRIFEPFFTTRDTNLGLGLPIAEQIVSAHGGKIAVDSSTGAGTSVSITLPVGTVRRE